MIGTAAGRIKLVDIEKNRVIWKEDLGDKNVLYDVDWGQNGMLAIGGVNKELCLRKFDKATQNFTKHKNVAIQDSIRCLTYNPKRTYQLAVGLFNGMILLVNSESGVIENTLTTST